MFRLNIVYQLVYDIRRHSRLMYFSVRRSRRQRTAAALLGEPELEKKGIFYATHWRCLGAQQRCLCWGFSTTIKVRRTDSICHGSNQAEMMHCNLSLYCIFFFLQIRHELQDASSRESGKVRDSGKNFRFVLHSHRIVPNPVYLCGRQCPN